MTPTGTATPAAIAVVRVLSDESELEELADAAVADAAEPEVVEVTSVDAAPAAGEAVPVADCAEAVYHRQHAGSELCGEVVGLTGGRQAVFNAKGAIAVEDFDCA